MRTLNKLKYDKVNIIAKCGTNQVCNLDMLYNATFSDRVNINTKEVTRYYNFFFNPKGAEERYFELVNSVLSKNSHMRDFKIKSLEVNFDYSTELEFHQLDLLSKVLADVLSGMKFRKVNINADIKEFDYQEDEFKDRITSYKFFRNKSKNSKNKFLEVKLYQKKGAMNRFEIIFYNSDSRLFKDIADSSIESGTRIKKVFTMIYNRILDKLNENQELYQDDGIAEFINAFTLTLSDLETEKAA